MRKIALVNQKGGVGKTTTTVNVARAIAELGQKVLVIDLDPQANATVSLGLRPNGLKYTVYSLLTGKSRIEKCIYNVLPSLDIIPCNINLAGIEMELANEIGREIILKSKLDCLSEYDYVLLDCPPTLGIVSVNGLCYSTEVMIPLQCEFFALQGLGLLMNTIDLVHKRLNPELKLSGVIITMYDNRKLLLRETLKQIEEHFAGKVFKTKIRVNVKLAEAPSHGKSIIDYAPESNGAKDYRELACEVVYGLGCIKSAQAKPESTGSGRNEVSITANSGELVSTTSLTSLPSNNLTL
jgi:chromosome partitioning protein